MNRSGKLTDIILITGIILLAAILSYVLFISRLHLSGNLKTYFFISIVGIVFLAAVLIKGSYKFKVNFTLFLFSFGLCVYMAEIFLGYYDFLKSQNYKAADLRVELNNKKGLPFDTRNSYEVMKDLHKEGINAYPNIVPNKFVYTDGLDYNGTKLYPLSSFSDMTTILCNESGEFVIYKSDEHGFRNPVGSYDKDFIDIVLVGDSFAHGNCVKDNHDISGWLRNAKKNVINLGMQASGPLIELAIIKEYAKPLKPQYVFWLYFEGNDDRDLIKEKKSSLLMKYLDNDHSQGLLSKQKLLDNMLISYISKEIRSKEKQINKKQNPEKEFKLNVRQTIGLLNLRFELGLLQACFFHIDPLLEDILVQAKREVNEWGGQFVVVYIPSWERFQKPSYCRKRLLSLQHQQVLTLLQEQDISFIDINQILDSHNDPHSLYPFRLQITGHFNSKGYNLIANEILDYVNSN